jgi:hypothetical protein
MAAAWEPSSATPASATIPTISASDWEQIAEDVSTDAVMLMIRRWPENSRLAVSRIRRPVKVWGKG